MENLADRKDFTTETKSILGAINNFRIEALSGIKLSALMLVSSLVLFILGASYISSTLNVKIEWIAAAVMFFAFLLFCGSLVMLWCGIAKGLRNQFGIRFVHFLLPAAAGLFIFIYTAEIAVLSTGTLCSFFKCNKSLFIEIFDLLSVFLCTLGSINVISGIIRLVGFSRD